MIVLALTGCFVRYEPIKNAAKAERQGAEEAESAWLGVLDEDLLVGEWRQARRRMCRLRAARVASEQSALDADTVNPEVVSELRESLQGCPHSGDLLASLTQLEQQAAVRDLTALAAQNLHPYASLLQARALAPHVLIEHPFRQTLDGWRASWTDQLQTTSSTYEAPVTQAFLGELLRDAGAPVTGTFADQVQQTLSTHLASVSYEADESCTAFVPKDVTGSGDGAPVHATIALTQCRTSDSRGQVQVPYQVTKYRMEEQQVPHVHRHTTITTTDNVNCYYSIQAGRTLCSYVGTSTDYDTEVTTTYTTEMVSVAYQETHYRTEDRFTKTASASATVTLQTAHGPRVLAPLNASDGVTGTSVPSANHAFTTLFQGERNRWEQWALAGARTQHLDTLEPTANLKTPSGIEARLTLHGAGRSLSNADRVTLAATFDLPQAALLADRPDLGDFAPRNPSGDPLAYRLPRIDDGLVRYGYSPLMYTAGVGHTNGGEFDAHSTPKSWGVHLNTELNGSVSTGRAANGLALHASPGFEIHAGWRANKKHTFVELPLGRDENDREPRMALGVRGGVGVLAGYRNTAFGLFAGVQPQAHFALTGFYKNGGTGLPLAARLEIRPVPRRPLILTGWYGDLLDLDNADYGARFSVPVGERFWLTAEHSRNTGRTQLLGLHDQDQLDGGRRAFTRTWVGYTYGF